MSLIRSHTIDSGMPGPHLLITAGVHGDEFEPMIAAYRLITIAQSKIRRGKVTIVPVVNHSAFSLGERCGDDKLDLARICPGKAMGSISEKISFDISSLIVKADYYIDLHNGGKVFNIFPLAGYMLHPDIEVLTKQRQMANAFSLDVVWGTDATPNGRTLSVARDANVPAIYVEYAGGSEFNNVALNALVNGCQRVMSLLGLSADEAEITNKPSWIIEDGREGSGYLQVKMPSPCDGIFIPAIKLGSRVEAGDKWGDICNPLSEMETEVLAECTGIVLFLRAFPKVLSGESLGGILVTS